MTDLLEILDKMSGKFAPDFFVRIWWLTTLFITWCLVHSIFWDIDGNDVEQLVLVLSENEVEKAWKLISEKQIFRSSEIMYQLELFFIPIGYSSS